MRIFVKLNIQNKKNIFLVYNLVNFGTNLLSISLISVNIYVTPLLSLTLTFNIWFNSEISIISLLFNTNLTLFSIEL